MKTRIEGTSDDDLLIGGLGEQQLVGLEGRDTLFGGKGADFLEAGPGADILNGGNGHDVLRGQRGADTFQISAGNDVIDGGLGSDWLDASTWSAGVYWNLQSFDSTDFSTGVRISAGMLKLGSVGDSAIWQEQTITGIENFQGSASRDFITASSDFGIVRLGQGADSFVADRVELVAGGRGADRISIEAGRAEGGRGFDVLSGSSRDGTAVLLGNQGNDTLIVSGATEARGGQGDDRLQILDGNTNALLFGGAGADVFEFNSSGSGQGTIQDFTPGLDRIDISSYTGRQGDTWADLQGMFEDRAGGVALVLNLQNFSNQTFTFAGLSRADLSEADFIL